MAVPSKPYVAPTNTGTAEFNRKLIGALTTKK